jgi:hypothetical protein
MEPPFDGAAAGVRGAQRVGVAAARIVVQVAAADGMDEFAPWEFDAAAAAAATPPEGQYRLTGCGTAWLCAPVNDTGARSANSPDAPLLRQAAAATPLVAGAAGDWAPPALAADYVSSGAYAAQLEWAAVYGEANSSARADADTDAAWFWRGGPNTGGVLGALTRAATQLLDAAAPGGAGGGGGGAQLWAAANVMARLTAAVWDAHLAAAAAKARAGWWRPETALRSGGDAARAGWAPELTNSASPDFPSAHAAACGAGAAALAAAFGDAVDVTLAAEDARGLPAAGNGGWDFTTPAGWQFDAATASGAFNLARGVGLYADDWLARALPARRYTSLAAMAAECAQSRRFGGVSLNASTDAGLALGAALGAWVAAAYPGNLTARAAAAGAVVDAVVGVPRRVPRSELPLDLVGRR